MKLLKNNLPLNKMINYTMYWHIFAILLKEKVILYFEFQSFFFKCIKLF